MKQEKNYGYMRVSTKEQKTDRQWDALVEAGGRNRGGKSKGVKFGCRKCEMPEQFEQYFEQWKKGKISIRKAAEELEIRHSMFYRRCKELEGKL